MTIATLTRQRQAAEDFARRICKALSDRVSSVILYGSVARGTARADSDVDVLVIADDGQDVRERLSEASEAADFETAYETFLIPAWLTAAELSELIRGGFPFGRSIVNEGVVLYDDGTFERIRESALASGGRNA